LEIKNKMLFLIGISHQHNRIFFQAHKHTAQGK
jgi:hypothetical protein